MDRLKNLEKEYQNITEKEYINMPPLEKVNLNMPPFNMPPLEKVNIKDLEKTIKKNFFLNTN